MEPVAELPPRRPAAEAGTGASRSTTRSPTLEQPAARPRRQGPALADLPPEVRHALQHPPRLLLADLRPPAGRRPLDRPDRGGPLRRPARRDGRGAAAPVRRRRHRPQHRRPLSRRRTISKIWFMSATSICPATRSSRSCSRATPARRTPTPARPKQADVKRIRDYRIEANGKKYQLLRGDFHRHTEISWDGGPDGSLEDLFRYAIDAAAFDWVANTDHDNGAGREYPWWLTQKDTDAYFVADHFTPVFSLRAERGLPARPPQRHVRPSRRADAAAAGGRRQTAGGRDQPRRHQDALPIPEGDERHLRQPHQRHQHGHRLARQRPGPGANGGDLPGRPRFLRIRGRPAGRLRPQGQREAGRHRRLGAEGLHQQRLRHGLQARLRVVERPHLYAHFLQHRRWRRSTTGPASWTPSASATATAPRTTSFWTCAAASTSWAIRSRRSGRRSWTST